MGQEDTSADDHTAHCERGSILVAYHQGVYIYVCVGIYKIKFNFLSKES